MGIRCTNCRFLPFCSLVQIRLLPKYRRRLVHVSRSQSSFCQHQINHSSLRRSTSCAQQPSMNQVQSRWQVEEAMCSLCRYQWVYMCLGKLGRLKQGWQQHIIHKRSQGHLFRRRSRTHLMDLLHCRYHQHCSLPLLKHWDQLEWGSYLPKGCWIYQQELM